MVISHQIFALEKMAEKLMYSFIVRDIAVTMDDNDIKKDLMRRYVGVEKVTRMFYDNEDEIDIPKTSVQVDFTLPTDAEKIHRDGNIVVGGICRRAYAIRKSAYERSNRKPRQNWENTTKPLCEQDLINMFEEQKRVLAEVLNSFETKLNDVIIVRQDKTTKPVLSTKT